MLEHAPGTGVGDRGGERFAVQVVCDIAALAEALGIDIDANVAVGLGSRAYLPRTGAHLSNAELSRVLCEGTLQMLVDHDGQPLWLGYGETLCSTVTNAALYATVPEAYRRVSSRDVRPPVSSKPTTSPESPRTVVSPTSTTVSCCAASITTNCTRKRWQIVRNGSQLTFYDRTRCLGSSGPARPDTRTTRRCCWCCHSRHTPRSRHQTSGLIRVAAHGGGEHLTAYALDELLHHLLTAAAYEDPARD